MQKGKYLYLGVWLAFLLVVLFLTYTRPLIFEPFISPENITIHSPQAGFTNSTNPFLNITLDEHVLELNISIDDNDTELCQACNSFSSPLLLSEGFHILTLTASTSDTIASKQVQLTIDSIPPELAFSGPTPLNDSWVNNTLTINLTWAETNVERIQYTIYSINDSLNETGGQSNETVLIHQRNFSIVPQHFTYRIRKNNTYFFQVLLADKAGWSNTTETRTILGEFSCTPSWLRHSICRSTDSNIILYEDVNDCGINDSLPLDNGTLSACDYCTPSLAVYYTSCTSNQKTKYFIDANNCFAATHLATDNLPSNTTESCEVWNPPQENPPTQTPQQNTPQTRSNTTTYPPKTYRLNQTNLTGGINMSLGVNDIIIIDFHGSHLIKLTSIIYTSAVLLFNDASYLISSGSPEKTYDLDGDSLNDFGMRIINVTADRRVIMRLREIPVLSAPNVTREVRENTTYPPQETASSADEINPMTLLLISGGVLLLCTIAVILLLVYPKFKSPHKKIPLKSKKEQTPAKKEPPRSSPKLPTAPLNAPPAKMRQTLLTPPSKEMPVKTSQTLLADTGKDKTTKTLLKKPKDKSILN